ncbi:MAG: tetratricopeptide repeat protein [Rhodoferax sp.]|uniref:nuclear transport factor 2 family protein n=1 Tax=Rhodoferax sp. TaxID=50421 RepID=UPI0026298644|nr:tetratricopeptide repeat protein [Rhodoferax sp.]MDD5334487.1 tetratricopeptide repeat protein [Rhodoferax sp.]
MKHKHSTIFLTLRLLALVAACVLVPAYADEYGDVSQLLRAGKLGEALIKADAYLGGKPNDPQMRFLKGVIQRSSGKQSEAIATFTKLTEDYPELPEPYNNLAVLYASQGQFDKARAALEMAIRTNPSYATAHENLGDVYARLASQAYNKALQLDGANAAVPPKLALIRELFGPANKGQRPGVTVAAAAAPSSAPAISKPVVPGPAPAPAPAAVPASAPVPVVAASKPAAVASKATVNEGTSEEIKGVEEAVLAWAKAWSAKDMSAYLGAYGKEFTPPAKQSRSAWEEDRRKRIVGKSSINVKLDKLSVTVSGTKAVAKFRQHYRAGALSVSSRKTLNLLKTGDRWLIIKESSGN